MGILKMSFLKLNRVPRSMITAEMVIEDINKQKIRPAKVEIAYAYTQKLFHDRLQAKEITRERILVIRRYLELHVDKWEYKNKKFNNDAHAIYFLMKSKSLKVRDFNTIQSLISTVDRTVESNWINISAMINK
jgi:hypothetical protein